MIKTLAAFLAGTIYKTNQTNKTVYLSDGTHWNARLFHQNLNLYRQLQNLQIAEDPEVKALRETVIEHIRKHKLVLQSRIHELALVVEHPRYMCNHYKFKYGKYKNMTVAEVAKEDTMYLDFMYANFHWFKGIVDKVYEQWAKSIGLIK